VADARKSADANSMLGCDVFTSPSNFSVYCYAQDSAGKYAACYTNDFYMTQAGMSVNDSSRIDFAWDGNGTCTSLAVDNNSAYQTK